MRAEALITHLCLTIAKMRRELFGQRSERKTHLLDQMELQPEELEATAAEDELAAKQATAALWLAILTRINDHDIQALGQLLPWNWKNDRARPAA